MFGNTHRRHMDVSELFVSCHQKHRGLSMIILTIRNPNEDQPQIRYFS